MAWSAPKVNWVATDYFNIEDWDRVRSNLVYANAWFKAQGWSIPDLADLSTIRGINALPTVQLINRLEQAIASMYDAIGVTQYVTKTWYSRLHDSYESNPTYEDWNRWELLVAQLDEFTEYLENYSYQKVSGTFSASTDTVRQRFSRG